MIRPPKYEIQGAFKNVSTQDGYLRVEAVNSCLVWQIQFNCRSVDLKSCVSDHSLFVRHWSVSSIILVVYVDDIVIFDDDQHLLSLRSIWTFFFIWRILSPSLLPWVKGRPLSAGPLCLNKSISLTYWPHQICWVLDELTHRWILLFNSIRI